MILHTVWVQSLENSLVKPSCAGGGGGGGGGGSQ